MAKAAMNYACQECGALFGKWSGQCTECGAWNSISQENALSSAGPSSKTLGATRGKRVALSSLSSVDAAPPRIDSGIGEFDRVLGGGLTKGSVVLVGGDPGIGKSTLMLQATAALAQGGSKAIYVSGEEARAQIRLRAERLGLTESPVLLAAETGLRDILTTLDAEKPDVVVIDSIQTMWSDVIDSAPGSVSQVRGCALELTNFAKRRGTAIILVGHVTKEGQIAGPRVVEHMVDTVLYFEGERGHQFRILRAVKNRFGPADEIGVFAMTGLGLSEVKNPSALFLGDADQRAPGSAVFAGIEGTRPVLIEIQALVAQSSLGTSRRAVVGWDSGRLAMVLAVLDARCGLSFGAHDVYLNVAGGLRIGEPAADLAVAAALISSFSDTPIPPRTAIFGEVSLSGAIRPVAQTAARMREAAKLGFDTVFAPSRSASQDDKEALESDAVRIESFETLADLAARFGGTDGD